MDAFLIKLNPSGNVLMSTFLGGAGDDRASAVGLDSAGNVYVAGTTSSNSIGGVSLSGYVDDSDGFVVKLDPTAHSILYAVAIGGHLNDMIHGMAVGGNGTVWVAGETGSSDLPVRSAAQTTLKGPTNGFVARLNSSGTIVYCTYIGGSASDIAEDVAADSTGAVWVVGSATSTDFPLVSALKTHLGGSQDAFVARLDSSGSTLLMSTYFGGSSGQTGLPEYATSVAVDSSNNAYISGVTSSSDFPVLNAYQSQFLGWNTDAFLSSFASNGTLRFSTYAGGGDYDLATSVALMNDGRILLGGYTLSSDFPVTDAAVTWHSGGYNGFFSVFDPVAATLLYSTYVNQGTNDAVYAVGGSAPIAAGVTTPRSAPGRNYATATSFTLPAWGCQLGSPSASVGATAGSGSVNVTAPSNYAWTASSNAGWLTISSGNSGTGNGTVNYSVTANTGTTSRVGTLTIGGQNFTVTQAGAAPASLSITKSHAGNFTQGQSNATYAIVVSNGGSAGATNGTVTVTDTLPSGLTMVSMSGSGWNCAGNTCTRADVLGTGASYPGITATVNVASNAPAQVTNQASVSGGGSSGASTSDVTTVSPPQTYTLALTAAPLAGGTVSASPSPTSGSYAAGTKVCLTASANSGYAFSFWAGTSLDGTNCLVMNANASVTANFVKSDITLTLLVAPANSGTVAVSPLPTHGTYTAGTTICLTATPNTGYAFGSWSGASLDVNNCMVLGNNTSITANFVQSTNVTLTLSVAPADAGTVAVNPLPTRGTYATGTKICLTATPTAGNVFSSWTGAVLDGSNCLVLNANTSITANFVKASYSIALAVSPSGTGSLSANPGPASGTYSAGSKVCFTATPNPGYVFLAWSGATLDVNHCLVVSSNAAVTANFGRAAVSLALSASPSGSGSVSAIPAPTGGTYVAGTRVCLTATPVSGYAFSSWSGASLDGSNCLVLNANTSVVANFVRPNVTLALVVSPGGAGSLTASPGGGTYSVGTRVCLTESPNSGYVFSSWSGSALDASHCLVLNSNAAVTANFASARDTLAVSVSPSGSGTVTASPAATAGSYAAGTKVCFTVRANSGYVFTSWSGGTLDSKNCLVISANTRLTASFSKPYVLTLSSSPTSGGTVTASPASTGGVYAPGTKVCLSAKPASTYAFSGWTGTRLDANNCLIMNASVRVGAMFTRAYTLTVTVKPTGSGTVTADPSSATHSYALGAKVCLTAIPNSGYLFSAWSGTALDASHCLVVRAAASVTATFKKN